MSVIKTTAAGQEHPDGQVVGATGEKLAFLGATPVVQRVGAAQTAITDSTGGSTANATMAAVGATNGSDVSATINANFAKMAVLVNELRANQVALGLIKGSA